MAEDASYSDDDFGSEADAELLEELHADAAQPPAPSVEAQAADGATVDDTSAAELMGAEDEAVEQYDAEFEEDESTAVAAANEELAVAAVADSEPLHPEQESVVASEASYSQEEGDDEASDSQEEGDDEALQEEMVLPLPLLGHKQLDGAGASDNAARRRSSLPSVSPRSSLAMEPSLPLPVRRTGSVRHVSSAPPSSKWLDTMPRDLSPEMLNRPTRSAVQLSIVKERPSVVLPESDLDALGDAEAVETSLESTMQEPSKPRERSASFQGGGSEMVPVPVRRAHSELYENVLPRVDEVQADELAIDADNATSQKTGDENDEDDYSDDEEDGNSDAGCGSQTSSERNLIPATSEGSTTPAGSAAAAINAAVASESAVDTEAAAVGNPPSESVEVGASGAPEADEEEYIDDLEEAFADEYDEILVGVEATTAKDEDYAGDFDIEDFGEENRRETEALLQEAQTLLKSNVERPENADTLIVQTAASEAPEVPEAPEASDEIVAASDKKVDSEVQPHDPDGGLQYDEEFADDDGGSSNQDSEFRHYAESDFDETQQEDTDKEHGGSPGMVNVDQVADAADRSDTSSDKPGVEMTRGSQMELAMPVISLEDTSQAQIDAEAGTPDVSTVKVEHPKDVKATDPKVSAEPQVVADKSVDRQLSKASTSPQKSATATAPKRVVKPQQAQAPVAEKTIAASANEKPRPPSRPSHRSRPLKGALGSTEAPALTPSRPVANRSKPTPPVSSLTPRERPPGLRTQTIKEAASPTSSLPTKTVTGNQPVTGNSMLRSVSAVDSRAAETTKSPGATPKTMSSPRSPVKPRPTFYLPEDYCPVLPRKEPVPKQKRVMKAPGAIANDPKRRSLVPVRTPANLRFDLPKDRLKRDWLFLNMFRHGDDVTKYEPFVPPAIFAEPSSSRGISKRPLSARQVNGDPHTAGAPAPGRKLVAQPSAGMRDRERNWVATKPHDSQIPAYDSILDKYCTTVTSPVIQRRIYQTRYTDLSPQLAFVLEKRVEKHYKQGLHDAFGGVSASYKTEVVPDLDDGRPSSPRSPRSCAASRPS